jgi:hypothetical protein
VAKFGLGDRVRKVGSTEVHIIEEVRESPNSETCYWTLLQTGLPTRVFVNESNLDVADVGRN